MTDETVVTNPVVEKTPEQIAAEKAAMEAKTTALVSTIKANFNNLVDVKEGSFHFKTVKLTAKDDKGEEKETGETYRRPTVVVQVPTPSVEGIIKVIEAGGKGLDLLLEACQDVVFSRARELINDDENITQENFPYDKLSWDAIANLPKSERRGPGIAKEVWDEFGKDYLAIMPGVTGKKIDAIALAVKLFMTKFNTVKTNKPVLNKMIEQLTLYLANSPQAETYAECVQFLTDKASNLLKVDDAELLANL